MAGAFLALASVVMPGSSGAQAVSWAHQNGSLQSNGAVTVKSVSGGSYAGTVNPSGAVAKANQNAVTQPPTIIVQATGNTSMIAMTTAVTTGNMGGVLVGSAMCATEFGTGWKMASIGRMTVTSAYVNIPAWIIPPSNAVSCSNFTSATGNGALLITTNSSGGNWGIGTGGCNVAYPVVCSNF